MAKQAKKIARSMAPDSGRAAAKQKLGGSALARPDAVAEVERTTSLRPLLIRLGLVLAAVWVVGLLVAGFSTGAWVVGIGLGIPGLATVAALGLVIWARRQAAKARGVAGIMSGATSSEDRKAAIQRLDSEFKKKDPAAVFAKAQLLLQDDPDAALAVLEQIDLGKVMGPVADQARGQRAMIHLLKGDVALARALVDAIELGRHQDLRERAMLGAVVAEAWARTGQTKKAVETLELFDLAEAELAPLKPQLHRARAYAFAAASRTKEMKAALRQLLEVDARLLGGFFGKKTHPLLQKEAKKLLEQSGQMPRKMVVQRRM